MNKYLKIWIKSALYFGISMGIFYTIQQDGYISGAITGAIAGLLFGCVMVAITYVSDRKMKGEGIENNSSSVHYKRSLTINLPIEALSSVIEQAISSIHKSKINVSKRNHFEAKVGLTWKSFGEDILITLMPTDAGIIAKIESKSSIKTTIVDYGKNLENVLSIVSFLEQELTGKIRDST